jgi:hypothetical protein
MIHAALDDLAGLRDLLDIEAIKQLKARYFRFVDTKQWDRLREVFTDDVRIFVGGHLTGPADSPDAFVRSVATHLDGVRSVHLGYLPEIEVAGDGTARGIWAMHDELEFPAGHREYSESRPRRRGFGYYEEEYRREPDGWRISFVRVTRLRIDRLPGGLTPAEDGQMPPTLDWL